MTPQDAFYRAGRIWGRDRVVAVECDDDGAWITLHLGAPTADARGRGWIVHRLNARGQIVCHDDCATLEWTRRQK